MDRLRWLPGWRQRALPEVVALTRGVLAQPEWILEGGHFPVFEERVARAEVLIWLDVPLWRRLWRVTRRTLAHLNRQRPDLPEGCRERIGRRMLNFYRFMWTTRNHMRARLIELSLAPPAHLRVCRLQTSAGVAALLAGWQAGLPAAGPDL
jgi:adenylate kinase family enzyme